LIEVNPCVRIPRTFRRFSGLMVQLLHKLYIRSDHGPDKLFRVIKNPVTDYLPPDCLKLSSPLLPNCCLLSFWFEWLIAALSFDAPVTKLENYLEGTLRPNQSVCVAVGAMAKGPDDFADDWVDAKIAVSGYILSASVASVPNPRSPPLLTRRCSKFIHACENIWGVL
jgi:rRNA small subunit pseudouridine methyltransferase Nep1